MNQKVKFLDKTKKKECVLGITSTFKGRGVYPHTLINAGGEKWNLINTVLPSPATAYYITDGILWAATFKRVAETVQQQQWYLVPKRGLCATENLTQNLCPAAGAKNHH